MPLAVRVQRVAAGGERRLQADRGQRVLQRAPRAGVHVNAARGRQRQAACVRERSEAFEPRTVAGAREKLDADPRPPGEHVGEPARPFPSGPDTYLPATLLVVEGPTVEIRA